MRLIKWKPESVKIDNEFDKAELYNYYTNSAYAESDEAIYSQYFDLQLRPLENTYTTFGLRRDEHTTTGEYYTGRITASHKLDQNNNPNNDEIKLEFSDQWKSYFKFNISFDQTP